LEDKQVLKQLPGGFRWLSRNKREDVILYFETFANLLEAKLVHPSDVKFYGLQELQVLVSDVVADAKKLEIA
jgi:hypothetical protein